MCHVDECVAQVYVEKELGFCEVEHVACGSGLERIYRFLQTDENCNRPHLDMDTCKACTSPMLFAHSVKSLAYSPVHLVTTCLASSPVH